MEKAKEYLHNEDNSLLVHGCNGYCLILQGKDITPVQIIQNTEKIQKYFPNHQKPSGLLKEIFSSVKYLLPSYQATRGGRVRYFVLKVFITIGKHIKHYLKIMIKT